MVKFRYVDRPGEFSAAVVRLDWIIDSNNPNMRLSSAVTRDSQRNYACKNGLTVRLERGGAPLSIDRCANSPRFDGNLVAGEGVLLASNARSALPMINLTFSSPVRGIGAMVSVRSDINTQYLAQLWTWVGGQRYTPLQPPVATLTRTRGGAPFLGLEVSGGSIDSVTFGAVDPDPATMIHDLAIGSLYVVF